MTLSCHRERTYVTFSNLVVDLNETWKNISMAEKNLDLDEAPTPEVLIKADAEVSLFLILGNACADVRVFVS